MASTYTIANLDPTDLDGAAWALAWVRFLLRDKPNEGSTFPPGSLDDDELTANLNADRIQDTTAGGGDDTYYFRPHLTASRLIVSNPTWISRWSSGGVSEEMRDASEVATAIRKANTWIDDAIGTATTGRVGGLSLEVVL